MRSVVGGTPCIARTRPRFFMQFPTAPPPPIQHDWPHTSSTHKTAKHHEPLCRAKKLLPPKIDSYFSYFTTAEPRHEKRGRYQLGWSPNTTADTLSQ